MGQSNEVLITHKRSRKAIIISVIVLFAVTLISLTAAILGIVVKIDKRSRVNIEEKTLKYAINTEATSATVENHDKSILTTVKTLSTYHFIIVGCGTSGAVLASRLSERPDFDVVCIERGPDDLPNSNAWNGMNIPNNFNFISPHDPIIITNQQKLKNKPIYIPNSMGLGGTSRIYGAINVRPSPETLANWPEGWRYDDLLPFYRNLENHYCHYDNTDISREICEAYHGKTGPMQVNNLDALAFHNLSKAFMPICNDTSQPWKGYSADYNGNIRGQPHGCSVFQQYKHRLNRTSNLSSFSRGSSKTGYLTSAVLERPNLSIMMNSIVTRIIFDDTAKAIGVEYFDPISHTIKRINALYEVILAAGVFATPHLLQVSGVGDADHLKQINVPLVVNNTHVGKNLNDHLNIPYIVQLHECDDASNQVNGPFSWIIQFNSGVRKNLSNNIRDIQIYVMDASDGTMTYSSKFCSKQSKKSCNANSTAKATFRIILQQNDFLNGTVKALTNSIFDRPAIDLGWTNMSNADKTIVSEIIKLLRSHTTNKSSEFGKLIEHELLPGTLTLDEYIENHIDSALHPASSCQLGLCTDEHLIVRGTKSLRVCDASSFGSQLDANPSATIFAMAEMLSEKLTKQYTINQQIGTWHIRDTLLVFESNNITPSSKIASFNLDDTLIISSPQDKSQWYFFNSFVISRLNYLYEHGYKIIIFTNQIDLCMNNNNNIDHNLALVARKQWQSKIESMVKMLQIPLQIFIATCQDKYSKPDITMWNDFIWLFNDGMSVDYKASFYVGPRNHNDVLNKNIQFAANIPLLYYLPEQQFNNNSLNMGKRHFNIIQTVNIAASANIVWKLIGGFFQIHEWHPQVLATEMNNERNSIKRRVIFAGEMIDTIEQLESFDNLKREYHYKNVGGNWGKLVQNYESYINVIEDNNGQSCIVRWIGSFDSESDGVTDFYRIGLNSLAALFSPPLPCSGGNSYFNKTLPTKQGRPNLSVYWRQEYNINASELWNRVGVWKGKLNDQLSLEPGSEYSFKLPDPTPRIYETLLSYDKNNYELIYCMRPTVPRSLPVTNYVSMKKVISTGPTSSAWIRTGHMIVDDGTTADQAANQVLMDVFVAGGERLRQQLQNTTSKY